MFTVCHWPIDQRWITVNLNVKVFSFQLFYDFENGNKIVKQLVLKRTILHMWWRKRKENMIWGLLESKGRVLRVLLNISRTVFVRLFRTASSDNPPPSVDSRISAYALLQNLKQASFIRNYSNSIGRLWWFVQFVFRAFIVTIVGSQGTGSFTLPNLFPN